MTESDRYLRVLRNALPHALRRRVVAELRNHLREGIATEMASGLDRKEAEQVTIARLGSAERLAAEFAADTPRPAARHAILLSRRAGVAVAGLAVLAATAGFAFTRTRDATPTSSVGRAAAEAASYQVEAPYAWGGASPRSGFDASGIVVWAYAQAGKPGLPHNSARLWQLGKPVTRAQLEPGDLVFFDKKADVGIYLGNGQFVDAPHTGAHVQVEHLDAPAVSHAFVGAIRLLA